MFHTQIPEAECLQSDATLVFRFRHFLCPPFCLILLPLSIPLLSFPIFHWLSFLHVSAFAAARHLFRISHGVYSDGLRWVVLSYLLDRSLNYINRIFRCRRQLGD